VAGGLQTNQAACYFNRQLISGCWGARYLSPSDALPLQHEVRLFDPERRVVRAPPRKCLGMCRRVTNKGEGVFGKASDRVTAEGPLNMLGPRTNGR